MFVIWDNLKGLPVGKAYTNKRKAHDRCDKLDNEYGAVRYSVRNRGL